VILSICYLSKLSDKDILNLTDAIIPVYTMYLKIGTIKMIFKRLFGIFILTAGVFQKNIQTYFGFMYNCIGRAMFNI
jgi:hypothetical protein